MDSTSQSQAQTLLSQFIKYCDKSNTQPTSQSLSRFFQNSKSKQIQKPKPKIVISTKKKQVVVIKKKENDYIVFTTNCRNNGFCVQEFQGKPAVFADYINCPDSKLVVYISQTNCTIIKYKFYNIVTPSSNMKGIIIDYEINPLVDQQLEDYHDYDTGKPAFLMNEDFETANIQTQSPYASNLDLNAEAGYNTTGDLTDDILDFTERNPFGEIDE